MFAVDRLAVGGAMKVRKNVSGIGYAVASMFVFVALTSDVAAQRTGHFAVLAAPETLSGPCVEIKSMLGAIYVVNSCEYTIRGLYCYTSPSRPCTGDRFMAISMPLGANQRIRVALPWFRPGNMRVVACRTPYKPTMRRNAAREYSFDCVS